MYDLDGSHNELDDDKIDFGLINAISLKFRDNGLAECKRLAEDISKVSLANSDNYAEFFGEVLELTRPVIKYRCI